MARIEGKQVWRMIRSRGRLGGYKVQRGHWVHQPSNLTGNWSWAFRVDAGYEFYAPSKPSAVTCLASNRQQWPAEGEVV